MSKYGLLISVYDKIVDLEILLEINRMSSLFSQVLVTVSSDAPIKPIEKMCQKYDAQMIITETPPHISREKGYFDHMVSLTSRVWITQREGLKTLAQSCDYIMHTHADGWFLNSVELKKILETVKNKRIDFAYRGVGLTKPYFPGAPVGSLDDHFYIVSSAAVKSSSLMKRKLVDCLPGYFNIHGILAWFLINDVGIANSYHYDDGKGWVSWDDKNVHYMIANPLRPYVLNSQLGLLHCHVEDFPNDTGRSLQANQIVEYGLDKKSEVLNAFLKIYLKRDIKGKLAKERKKLKLQLAFFLYYEYRNNNLAFLANDLQKFRSSPLRSLIMNFLKLVFQGLTQRKLLLSKRNIVYPKMVEELIQDNIKPSIGEE
jgi:hypothetical protein